MQENISIEREAKMPRSFFISPKWIKNSKARLIIALLLWGLFNIYFVARGYTIGDFLQDLCVAIVMFSGYERWQQLNFLVRNNQPLITVEEKFIRYANAHEFATLQLEDISTIKLKRGLLGKFIKIRFNKKLDDDRSLIADYNKYLTFLKKNRNRKSCKWIIPGFTIEPEEIEQAVNDYLRKYKERLATYPSTWDVPKFLQHQKGI